MHNTIKGGMIFIVTAMAISLGIALNQIRVLAIRLHHIEEFLYQKFSSKEE
jgi:hypothetical protein